MPINLNDSIEGFNPRNSWGNLLVHSAPTKYIQLTALAGLPMIILLDDGPLFIRMIRMTDIVTKMESWLSSLLLAVILTVIGLLMFFMAGRATTLNCSRKDADTKCLLTSNILNRYFQKEMSIPNLQSAYVEEDCSDDCSYRVILVTSSGEQPLTNTSDSDQTDKQHITDQINTFLSQSNIKDLTLVSEAGAWPYAGIALTIIGLLIALWTGVRVFLSTLSKTT